MYEDGPDGFPVVSGLRMAKAGEERIVKADAYVAALDVPGAKRLIPEVLSFPSFVGSLHAAIVFCLLAVCTRQASGASTVPELVALGPPCAMPLSGHMCFWAGGSWTCLTTSGSYWACPLSQRSFEHLFY